MNVLQNTDLLVSLDALGQDSDPQLMPQLDHGAENRNAAFRRKPVDQILVQLDAVDGILLQIGKGCETDAEVVERNAYAELLERRHIFPDAGHVRLRDALRQLKDQQLPRKAVGLDDRLAAGNEILGGKRLPGKIAGDEKPLHSLFEKRLQTPAGFLQTIIIQLVDQPLALKERDKRRGRQQPPGRVLPPGERFSSHHAERLRVHIKLQVQGKFTVLQRLSEARLQTALLGKPAARLISAQNQILAAALGVVRALRGIKNNFVEIPILRPEGIGPRRDMDLIGLGVRLRVGADPVKERLEPFLRVLRVRPELEQDKALLRHLGQNVRFSRVLLQDHGAVAQKLVDLPAVAETAQTVGIHVKIIQAV